MHIKRRLRRRPHNEKQSTYFTTFNLPIARTWTHKPKRINLSVRRQDKGLIIAQQYSLTEIWYVENYLEVEEIEILRYNICGKKSEENHMTQFAQNNPQVGRKSRVFLFRINQVDDGDGMRKQMIDRRRTQSQNERLRWFPNILDDC